MADRIQDEYDVGVVWVKVMKPGAPIDGSVLGYAAVEILRGEEEDEEEEDDGDEYEDEPG